MKAFTAALMLLMVAITPFALAGNKGGGGKKSGGGGGGGGGHAGGGRGAFGGGGGKADGNRGMMHQGGGNGGMHGNKGNAGQHGQHAGGLGHQGQGAGQARGANRFSTKSHGQTAFRANGAAKAGLHTRATGSFASRSFHAQKYSAVFHDYHRVVHERTWWVSHYNRVVVVGGGYYYWNAGYWYPAWGYDPAFVYVYDGPIYSYDNLPPDEVIGNVQSELEFQGYYHGRIDGRLGPETQAAISEFQRDHDLEVTSVVDEPTVNLLGLA
jgi:hypothetical protein